MDLPETNLLGFLGAEEQNLLTSMVWCHRDIAIAFPKLDGAFQAPIKHVDININNEYPKTILALYLFTHYHLYLSTSLLLRCHLSDSLASTRKAIDATLTAYRLISEPGTLNDYKNRHRKYQFIKGYVERKRKNDPDAYPLAPPLLDVHDKCSEYGSHADISSFVHRVSIEDIPGTGKGIYRVGMFQLMSELEVRHHMVMTFLAYTTMLKIYSEFVGGLAQGLDRSAWVNVIDGLLGAIFSEAGQIEVNLNGTA